jgi:hypothetical protein
MMDVYSATKQFMIKDNDARYMEDSNCGMLPTALINCIQHLIPLTLLRLSKMRVTRWK